MICDKNSAVLHTWRIKRQRDMLAVYEDGTNQPLRTMVEVCQHCGLKRIKTIQGGRWPYRQTGPWIGCTRRVRILNPELINSIYYDRVRKLQRIRSGHMPK